MSLDLALGVARSGLLAVGRGLAQTAQNIGNAETPGYTRKSIPQESVTVGDKPAGVRTGEARRSVDAALVMRLDSARSDAAAAELRERLLTPIEQAHGAVGEGQTLADGVAGLRDTLTALRGAPSDTGLQRGALQAATQLAGRFNDVAAAVGNARQDAQDAIVAEVANANAALREIAALTDRLKRGADGDTAAIEDQRDAAVARLAASIEVRAVRQSGGDLLLIGRGGVVLPLDAKRDVLGTASASVGPGTFYGGAGTLPGVMLGGRDITSQLVGGRLAEAVQLRDATLPRYQAELDVGAAELGRRFAAQGLRLFTDVNGTVPNPNGAYAGSQQVGFAGRIRVNPAVVANATLLRDGTTPVTATPGGPTAFTPNPATGPAGFVTLLDRVLDYSLGSEVAAGVAWAPIATTGLGPDGTLASPFLSPGTIEGYAGRVTVVHTADRGAATAAKDASSALRTSLEARLASQSGVDVDAELAAMVVLQNAYAANARVLSTVQTMWDTLLASVR